MHTLYIKDAHDECIATIFAEDGAIITKADFLQALPESKSKSEKVAYYTTDYVVKIKFPIFVKKSLSLYVK